MNIRKIGVPSILPDNDIVYMKFLFKLIKVIDDECLIKIYKTLSGYKFVLSSKKKEELIEELIEMHNILGLDIEFSKSIKLSKDITYFIK